MLSETVTNAVIHGRSVVRVTITTGAAGVRAEVGDDNPHQAILRAHDLNGLGGRGILLLDAAANGWGVRPDGPGKTAWFEVRAT